MKYYYYENSERKGPVVSVRLREMARKGEIRPDTILENEFGNRAEASKIGSFASGFSLEKEFAEAAATAPTVEVKPVEKKTAEEKNVADKKESPKLTPIIPSDYVAPKIDGQSIDLETSVALDLTATNTFETGASERVLRPESTKVDVSEINGATTPKPTSVKSSKAPESPQKEAVETSERSKPETPPKPEVASSAQPKRNRLDPKKDPFEELNVELREEIRKRREEISKPAPRTNMRNNDPPKNRVAKDEKPKSDATPKNAPTKAPETPPKGGSSCLFWIVVVAIFLALAEVFEEHPAYFFVAICVVALIAWFRKQPDQSTKT